ncbi:nucleoside diphosphate kinase regulator [Spectribacter hydrogenoxidans]|uniref:Nucleoside diphosphate kinase regulator n=1 Tax=Spectribacter hydrogenoxidans TaxID=3075608 RepID=A0ABU3C2G5_9GAMM|nr:nucleoside diphosphate kinase regulator [Salinisphaera sp. W335]MDT0635705.1 nucleoside diphosphate kinase regulator [Salinisphaera sp. W335]
MQSVPITVTEHDYERIDALLAQAGKQAPPGLAELRRELERAEIVDEDAIPEGVVTMNSTVSFENTETGARFELTLVYPKDIDGSPGKVSILAPVGSALLGLSAGQAIEWQVPGGNNLKLHVLDVRDQPEARMRYVGGKR